MPDRSSPPLPPVESVLPHRPPFLLVDQVTEMSARRIVAVRTFRADEPFFKGHFPGHPIVPGVLLIEALAQTMAYFSLAQRAVPKVFLVGIDRARFRSVVEPGQQVTLELEVGEERFGLSKGRGRVRVGERAVADAELSGYTGEPGKALG